jgi:hypothetical protein
MSVGMRHHGPALAVAVLVAMSAGCSSGARGDLGDDDAKPPTSVENRRAVVEKEGKPGSLQRAPRTDAVTQGSGEVPPQILAIFQDDLARRALVKHDQITVVSATEQQWPDGAMGCPQPGQMYTQMIVPGYRVVLQAAGERYAYHSDRRGNFIVCSNGLSFPPVKEQIKNPAPAE